MSFGLYPWILGQIPAFWVTFLHKAGFNNIKPLGSSTVGKKFESKNGKRSEKSQGFAIFSVCLNFELALCFPWIQPMLLEILGLSGLNQQSLTPKGASQQFCGMREWSLELFPDYPAAGMCLGLLGRFPWHVEGESWIAPPHTHILGWIPISAQLIWTWSQKYRAFPNLTGMWGEK